VTRVPGEFVMLARVFGTLGGMLSHYRPRIDYARAVLPHLFRPGAV
jgi:ubiquinone biosynthesis protein